MPAHSLDSLIISPADFDRYNGHHKLETFELPRSSKEGNDDSTSTIMTTPCSRSIISQDIIQWLRQPGCHKKNPDDPSMKILLIQTHNQSTVKKNSPPSLSMTQPQKTFDLGRPQTTERNAQLEFINDVFSGMGFPLAAFGAYIKAHITFVCVPATSTSKLCKTATQTTAKTCTKYYCSGTSWTITWSHCPALKHTAAVMFHREGDGDQRREEVLADLIRLQSHLAHPMLLGYVKTKVSLRFTFDMLDDMNRETLALEQEIGFPTWNWVLDRMIPGSGVGETHDHAVEGFNVLAGKLTNIRFRLRTFQQQIKFISRCNAKYRQSLEASSPSSTISSSLSPLSKGQIHDPLLRECEELDAFMDVMWDYTFVHLFDADSLSERLHNAMTSVFQLTTQRDSRASLAIADFNNELARQGKNTNTSMMTIAFVSLLFLPGTFVASFFDTPIFNFPIPSSPDKTSPQPIVVTQPFWIYWTISGMLTLILGVGWMSYLRRRKALDMREREGERIRFRETIGRKNKNGLPQFFDSSPTSTVSDPKSFPTSSPPDYHTWKSGFEQAQVQAPRYNVPQVMDGGGGSVHESFKPRSPPSMSGISRSDSYGLYVSPSMWYGGGQITR
ncbi:hypothetical protein LTR84_006373 [Exophiala bonariae]|uniref:Uncharacterized protein n=1 Tax=Exophiala bonariae TaxID=1690606 RepID=A0AAV9N149_9EURO|nr:hypothetical protein LTR84_006373 [Exophiala bonariae]